MSDGDGVDLGVDDDARGVDEGVGVGVASVNGRRVLEEKFTSDVFARRERLRVDSRDSRAKTSGSRSNASRIPRSR